MAHHLAQRASRPPGTQGGKAYATFPMHLASASTTHAAECAGVANQGEFSPSPPAAQHLLRRGCDCLPAMFRPMQKSLSRLEE